MGRNGWGQHIWQRKEPLTKIQRSQSHRGSSQRSVGRRVCLISRERQFRLQWSCAHHAFLIFISCTRGNSIKTLFCSSMCLLRFLYWACNTFGLEKKLFAKHSPRKYLIEICHFANFSCLDFLLYLMSYLDRYLI